MTEVWRLLRTWADSRLGGMNDSQIARALGVNPAVVGKWKAGSKPSPANIRRIAEVTTIPRQALADAVLVDLGYGYLAEASERGGADAALERWSAKPGTASRSGDGR